MYLRSSVFARVTFSAFFALLIGAGCTEQPAVVPLPGHGSPEESFEQIVTVLKEGLELPGGQASGFFSPGAGSSSRFRVHNTVTSELLPPAKEGEPYRGLITVSTQSIYSLRTSAQEDDKKDSTNAKRGASLLDESAESGPGFSSFDDALVTESDAGGSDRKDFETVQRRADKIDRQFELVYKNQRWELATEIDEKSEASIENAFERALTLQP